MQYIACRFSPVDTRHYTYANEGPEVAVGDFVKVEDRRGGSKRVEVVAIVEDAPTFDCKPILGLADDAAPSAAA